eukprot:305690-Pelagomonas_calceolata.AAC.1
MDFATREDCPEGVRVLKLRTAKISIGPSAALQFFVAYQENDLHLRLTCTKESRLGRCRAWQSPGLGGHTC